MGVSTSCKAAHNLMVYAHTYSVLGTFQLAVAVELLLAED